MPVELFSDNAQTTLTSSPSAAATSFTVASSAGFPAASNAATPPTQFRVLIGSEMVTVTNVAGAVWSCQALAGGHTSGDAVTQVVFASDLAGLQYPMSGQAPAGAAYETFFRNSNYPSAQGLVSGVLQLSLIALPKGISIPNITFVSAGTAAVSMTNWWFGLYDANRVQLALTANQGAGGWAANTMRTLPIASTASGAASSFTTTYAGVYYLGVMASATTPPGLVCSNLSAGLMPILPLLGGLSDTAQAGLPAFPHTALAISSVFASMYALVGA